MDSVFFAAGSTSKYACRAVLYSVFRLHGRCVAATSPNVCLSSTPLPSLQSSHSFGTPIYATCAPQTTRIHQLCVICMRQKLKQAQKNQSLSLTLIPFLHSFVTRHNYTIHNFICPSLPPWLAILAGCETCAQMKMQEGRKILPTLSTLIVRIPPHLLWGVSSLFFPSLE